MYKAWPRADLRGRRPSQRKNGQRSPRRVLVMSRDTTSLDRPVGNSEDGDLLPDGEVKSPSIGAS